MSDREELEALRRLAELEAKASGQSSSAPGRAVAVEQPKPEVSYLTRAKQFASGFNQLLPGIAGLPVDTALNVADLAKAGVGTVANLAGRPDLAPELSNRQEQVGSSQWIMKKLAQNKLEAPFVAPGENDSTSRMLQASGAGLAGALATKQPMNPRVIAATQSGAVGAQGVRDGGGSEASAQIAGLLAPTATVITPAVTSKIAKTVVTPFNARMSAEKRINESAGKDASAREKIAQALLEAKRSELGSPVTVKDAIAEANVARPERFGGGLVRLQSELERHPASSDRARTLEKAQEAARVKALDDFAKTDADVESARSARTGATSPLYSKVRKNTNAVDTSGVMARVDDVLQRNVGNPDIRREFAAIREDLSRAGNNAEKVASVLDGMKSRIANQDNKFIKGELDKVKADIVSALPGMKEANAKFAEMSEPINQMQVGQALRSKLAGPRGEERSAQFSSAVREAPDIIKRSTGQTRFHSIDDVLTPQQAKVVSAINKELRRDAEAARMASETDTSGALHRGVPTAPALFDPKITLLNKALKSIGHDMDSKTAIEAQKIIESPAKTAAILTRPKSDPMRRVVEAVLQSTAARGPTINMEGER